MSINHEKQNHNFLFLNMSAEAIENIIVILDFLRFDYQSQFTNHIYFIKMKKTNF